MNSIVQLLSEAKAIEPYMIQLRRDFHRFPELSFQEARTADIVKAELEALGLRVQPGIGGHGIVAELHGDHLGPTVAFRADMDALPIQEETGLAFASEHPKVMHACGHDAHTAILLGTARLLAGHRAMLHGKVRLIFQSAEEILAGAKAMIAEGVLEGVDEIYGLHNLPQLPAGQVSVKAGVLMGSIDRFEIRVTGKGGHGGYPHSCIDPIVGASAIVMGLQTAVSREIAATDGVVISLGTIQGGTANNVIPDYVDMTGTIRALDPKLRQSIPERIERIVQNICQAYRCEASVQFIEQVAEVNNDEACAEIVAQVADNMLGHENCRTPLPMTYGEDFAEFLQRTKGCFFWLGSGTSDKPEENAGLHSARFNLDERCLSIGAAMFAGIALQRLQHT